MIEFRFEGRPVAAEEGQSIGAALHAAGIRSWRTTRFGGRPRGLFCAVGACFDCQLTVNGTPDQRACQTVARAGDEVTG